MTTFRTVSIDEMPPSPKKASSGIPDAIRDLPSGMAVLIPTPAGKETRKFSQALGGYTSRAVQQYPERAYHTRIDLEADGVWVWWTER